MATKSKIVCDVCGSERNVSPIEIEIKVTDKPLIPAASVKADLCPRHQNRMVHFVKRGTTKPSPKAGALSI